MTQYPELSTADVASGLLDVLPRLLRRLRADLSFVPETPCDDTEWQSLAELRSASGQVALMSILVNQGRANMQDLATQLAVKPGTVTMMVKRLLAQGYVERTRDEGDWRLVWVSPTERGRQVIHLYNQERQASLGRKLAQLDREECACMEAALPALSRLMEVS